jgi:hypothetical protein
VSRIDLGKVYQPHKGMLEGIHNTKDGSSRSQHGVAAPHSPTPTLLTTGVEPPASGIRTPSHGRAFLWATAEPLLMWSRLSLCVVNNQPVGNPKRKV